jgi:lysozyme
MKMSPVGRKKLTAREGKRLKAYKDSVGVWTIGVGHTSMAGPPKVKAGMTITDAESDAIFARDLVKYENAVNKAVKVPLTQNQFDALTSLCFNIGPTAFAKSTLVRKLNAGDIQGAANAFLSWNKAGGKVIPGLVTRRKAERAQFLSGPALPLPPPRPPELPEPEPPATEPDPPVDEPDPEPPALPPEPPKTVGTSKTLWTVLTGFLATAGAALSDWKVAGVICTFIALAAFLFIGRERIRRIIDRGI